MRQMLQRETKSDKVKAKTLMLLKEPLQLPLMLQRKHKCQSISCIAQQERIFCRVHLQLKLVSDHHFVLLPHSYTLLLVLMA